MIKAVTEFQPTQTLRYKWHTRYPAIFKSQKGLMWKHLLGQQLAATISPAELHRHDPGASVSNSFQMTDKIRRARQKLGNLDVHPTAL